MSVRTIEREALPHLFDALKKRGYRLVGPRVRDGAIVYEELGSPDEMPIGRTDEQNNGTYRLRGRDDKAVFGYVVGPHSWKKFLLPSVTRLVKAVRTGGDQGFECLRRPNEDVRFAFIGVRSCDLNAIAIQDRVLLAGSYVDPLYKARRERAFILAINCTEAGGTCFCVSMGTGPKALSGFDLALTEVLEGGAHFFTVDVGSERGKEVLQGLTSQEATLREIEAGEQRVRQAASNMGRAMETRGIKELLYRTYEHPRWHEVASRCLTCGNCTMVCPTCFCTTVEDTTDLSGGQAERIRRWDSCFTMDFSYIHGGSVRKSERARYRQWLTHKLGTWIDQFGTLGCVGCGRCITWCPVGIDITEEVDAIRRSELGDR